MTGMELVTGSLNEALMAFGSASTLIDGLGLALQNPLFESTQLGVGVDTTHDALQRGS